MIRFHGKLTFEDGHIEEIIEEDGEFFMVPLEPDLNPIVISELDTIFQGKNQSGHRHGRRGLVRLKAQKKGKA
jgi:hypothetical protein